MSRLLSVLLVAVLASAARAGGNPDVCVYLTFDYGGGYVHHIEEPEPYRSIDVWLYIGRIDTGVSVVSFRMADPAVQWPGVLATSSFVTFWPT